MKRFSAHFIFLPPVQFYQLYYVELDDSNYIQKILPMESEIAQTSFCDGVIAVLNDEIPLNISDLKNVFIDPEKPVKLYHLPNVNFLSSEFSTSDSGSNCYIQRLC
jgi:hypothetical protein